MLAALLALTACSTTSLPDVSPDGLVRVKGVRANSVYVLPGADLSGYNSVMLAEPTIAFMKSWKTNVNSGRMMNRVTDSDMENMIDTGKKLLTEEFIKELEKGGYQVVTKASSETLMVEPSITNLDIFAPDPNNQSFGWVDTYSNGSGRATLTLELFDSVTGQLLTRASDTKTNENDGFTWRVSRSQATNIMDARSAMGSWARMLVNGLDKAKEAPFPEAPPVAE